MLTQEQLEQIMVHFLISFAPAGMSVDASTVHGTVLDATNMGVYQAFVNQTLFVNGHNPKQWPVAWMTQTVSQVAPAIM